MQIKKLTVVGNKKFAYSMANDCRLWHREVQTFIYNKEVSP